MFKTDQWLSSLHDLYINIHELLAAPRLGVVFLWLCCLRPIGQTHPARRHTAQIFTLRLKHYYIMSSLYKPFSVSEGPCKDAILRRGCTPQQHPKALTRIASAGGGSTRTFTPIPQIYLGQRNLAAAAIGGRKITHPWKAILAGTCVFVFVLEAHKR